MRQELMVDRETEGKMIAKVIMDLKNKFSELDPTNTVVVMVSPDYSATIAMHMAHWLSSGGEMCDLMIVDVPYPDQESYPFAVKLTKTLRLAEKTYENYVLAEAGVIRGGNYQWICNLMHNYIPETSRIITTTMYENIHSKFQSDIVGQYYDDKKQDLTFYYEEYNKHWD